MTTGECSGFDEQTVGPLEGSHPVQVDPEIRPMCFYNPCVFAM